MRATEYFYNNDLLGMVLTNVQDVLKAHDLGLSIMTENEDYLDERYDEEIDNNRDATTDEIIEDAQTAFKAGGKLYATLDVPNDYEVIPRKATNLQSDFYVGQKVYTMENNKAIKAELRRLWLSLGTEKTYSQDTAFIVSQIMREMHNCVTTCSANDATKDYIGKVIDESKVKDENMAYLVNEDKHFYKLVKLSEVFATKEGLVKHLMEEE